MKAVILLLCFTIAALAAFWFVWENRASEKIVNSTVPIAIAGLVGISIAGLVFGGKDAYEVVFPVSYMLDLRTKLPINSYLLQQQRDSWTRLMLSRLKEDRPDLFASSDKNDFARTLYHHLLQRSVINFLELLYRGTSFGQCQSSGYEDQWRTH